MPSPRLSPPIARLAGLSAFGAVAGLVAVLALVLFFTRPNRPGSTGGIDPINSIITWVAFLGVGAALITVHVVVARQLLAESRGERRGI